MVKTDLETKGKLDACGYNPLDLVKRFSTYTGRAARTEEAIQAKMDSLLQIGQETPFVFRKDKDKRLIVVSGHTRILAAARITELGLTDAKGVTYSPENPFWVYGTYVECKTDVDAVIHTFVENDQEPLNGMDYALLIDTLSREHGLKDMEIAARLGKKPAQIYNWRKFLDLDQDTKTKVISGEINDSVALTLAKIAPEERPAVLESAKKNGSGRVTAVSVAQAVRKGNIKTEKPLGRTTSEFRDLMREKAKTISHPQGKRIYNALADGYWLGEESDEVLLELIDGLLEG